MNRVSTRHVGLGIAGALVTSTRDVARLSLWAAKAGSRTPLAAPLRGPARRLIGDAEHRGALNEARLLSDAAHISTEAFASAVRSPLLDHVIRSLAETGDLERVLSATVHQGAGTRTDEPVADRDAVERLALHVHLHLTDRSGAGDELRRVGSRGGIGTVDAWTEVLAGRRLHGPAHAALLAGFEDGVAPA
jgi:hypothetical protein